MKRKQKTAVLLAAVMMILAVLAPVGGTAAAQTGTIFGGWLILRAQPSQSAAVLSSYPSGTVVTITGQSGSWYAVTAPDGLRGYMLGDYIKLNGDGIIVPSAGTAYVTSSNGLNVRLRSGPGTNYATLASYAPGTQCTILSVASDWCRIRVGTLTGYMMTRYLTNTAPAVDPGIVPAQQSVPADGFIVYITSRNGRGVNLRQGPGKNYASIGFYSVGTQAWCISSGPVWSYIQIGSRTGYMMSQFLTTTQVYTEVSTPVSGSPYVVSANGRNVNLRSAPSTGARIIGSFRIGTQLTIITRGQDWYFVQIGGLYGYMMRQFIYDGGVPATITDLI